MSTSSSHFECSKCKYIVLVYIFAQVMGGVVGAGLVYSQYIRAIDIFEGARNVRTQATASFFSSYAVSIKTPFTKLARPTKISLKLSARLYDRGHMFLLRILGNRSSSFHDHGRHRQEQRGASHWAVASCPFPDSSWAWGCVGHANRYASISCGPVRAQQVTLG